MLESDDVALGCLHGEARLDEQHGILGYGMTYGCEGGKGSLHRARGGYAAERVDVNADESLDKLACSLLDAGYATIWGILRGGALGESLGLGTKSYL